MAKRPAVKNWTVTMRCVVIKEVSCPGCTEEDARTKPWDMAEDERETSMDDWEVINVTPNE